MTWIKHLLVLNNARPADRSRLALENIALRQQIVVLKPSVKREKINDHDRVFWILMRRLLDSWPDTLLIVKPAILISWHRKGWRYSWSSPSTTTRSCRPD